MGEIIAGIAITGLGLAVIISLAEMFKRWVDYKEAELAARGAGADNQALQERVKVLERIVTERGFDISTQIEALRDPPADTGIPLNIARERA